jgi:hypothetical protein
LKLVARAENGTEGPHPETESQVGISEAVAGMAFNPHAANSCHRRGLPIDARQSTIDASPARRGA